VDDVLQQINDVMSSCGKQQVAGDYIPAQMNQQHYYCGARQKHG